MRFLCELSAPNKANVFSTNFSPFAVAYTWILMFFYQIQTPVLTTAKMDDFLATIRNSTGGQKIAQFIGSVTSVLNHKAQENKSTEVLQKSIQVIC